MIKKALSLVSILALLMACSPVEDPSLFPEFEASEAQGPPPKSAVPANPLRNLLWGDLHIHTGYSVDAYTMGTRTLPDDAYRFTRGGTIEHGAGYPIRIDRPLDFAAVTDHAEYMGVLRLADIELPLSKRSLRTRLLNDGPLSLAIAFVLTTTRIAGGDLSADVEDPYPIMEDTWQQTIAAAERHNEPGVFSTFVAYEWTSMPDSQNLHRNVVYRDTLTPVRPFSSLDSKNPEDLWSALDAQREQGMQVFAIPHNGNLSNGQMYDRVSFSGESLNAGYAEQRMRNEPLSEIMQIKGSSDTHPTLSPEDEFADFEILNEMLSVSGDYSQPKGSYARDALRTGLELSHREGFNPYRFGVIGSSDSHNSSTSVEEDNHHGKLPIMDGTAALRLGKALLLPEKYKRQMRWSSAGLAAVWAQENTRASLFDAMRRKETYATSGPRIQLRFFAGWNYQQDMMLATDLLDRAYAGGVPMGGELAASESGGAPRFALWAARDPEGANLDRLQVIKGWVDGEGNSHERIFDVAVADGRKPGGDGHIAPVGSTVDVATASYSNSVGDEQLSALWQDPEFDPALEAFYYARAIEIPTPRWSTYDAQTLKIPAPQPDSLQERAISSAIWYRGE